MVASPGESEKGTTCPHSGLRKGGKPPGTGLPVPECVIVPAISPKPVIEARTAS